MPAHLSVNLNAVALLRNRRDLPWPSVIELGRAAMHSGAKGLTIHPRPDQRHIKYSDVPLLCTMLGEEFPSNELNIEGFPSDEFLDLVESQPPKQVTLVPDDPWQATSNHGWDFHGKGNFLRATVHRLREQGIRVSLFCDPDAKLSNLEAAKATGADRVELFTGPYGGKYDDPIGAEEELKKLEVAGKTAANLGLGVNAGHDLTVDNLPALLQAVPNLLEVSVGHGLIADALEHGMPETVRRFMKACS